MNKTDAAKLLAVASGFDRRQVDELTAAAWASALDGYSYSECERAIVAHHRDPATRLQYLTVGLVLDRLEQNQRTRRTDVEADVRSAKARRLIDENWPAREPLPTEAAYKLAAARERDRLEAVRLTEIEAP